MVEYTKKCSEGVGEVLVTDIAQVEMKTRALAAEEVGAEKRRKVGSGGVRLPSSTFGQITTEEDTRGPSAATASGGCDQSCCSSNGSTEELQFTDLKDSVEFETIARYNLDTRARKLPETITPTPSPTINSRRTVPAAELEEFFASTEKNLQKRFKDKYNYDIVNDAPLEGRFEWVQLKP